MRTAQLIPPELPLLKDPKFIKDREDFTGRSWNLDEYRKGRPEAIAAMRNYFGFLEEGLLKDGREWIGETKRPGMADIHCGFLTIKVLETCTQLSDIGI